MLIGQLSKLTGVPVRTIRFYEDNGVLPPPPRTASGYRDYEPHSVNRLRFLRAAQDAGLSLAEIRSILAIRDRGEAPCVHTRRLLESKRREVEERVQHLRALAAEIDRLVEQGRTITEEVCDPDGICSIIPV